MSFMIHVTLKCASRDEVEGHLKNAYSIINIITHILII